MLPASLYDERKLRKDDTLPMHKDINYIDGLNCENAFDPLDKYGGILINDGLSSLGFGVHDNSVEIMGGKYNVVTLWPNKMEKYRVFFVAHNIYHSDNITTAWDTFTDDTPSECFLHELNGKNVYSLKDDLKDWGIYFAEQREVR